MEILGKDALAILDDLNIERVHWCGLSIGGMVGQWLAANAPERFDRIVLASTSSFFPDQTNWDKRLDIIRQSGLAPIANSVIASWFTRDFREREPEIVKRVREMLCHAGRGLYRRLAGDRFDGQPGVIAAHQKSDFGDCGPSGSFDAARNERIRS